MTGFAPPGLEDQAAGPGRAGWAGVGLLVAVGALAALVEAFLVPLYAGSTIVPITVVLGVVGNIALPRMARALVPRTGASLLPLIAWLAVVLLFSFGRPEGDVVFPGAPTSAELTFYGLLLGGTLAGVASVALSVPPPVRREDVLGAGDDSQLLNR